MTTQKIQLESISISQSLRLNDTSQGALISLKLLGCLLSTSGWITFRPIGAVSAESVGVLATIGGIVIKVESKEVRTSLADISLIRLLISTVSTGTRAMTV